MSNMGFDIFNELNYLMSEKEIHCAALQLKRNKAAGTDGIINEMIKSGISVLSKPLCKLFNCIFSNSHFPITWRINTLSPLHKKGDSKVCDNFRGIAVGCCLSKLFLSVLNNRLKKFADKHSLIPAQQIGYREKSQTLDHILTLKNIIDKYINRTSRKYLFVCFVDFKAAFDSIWRQALFYKLAHLNIGGNFLRTIQSMYSNVQYSVKLQGGISRPFASTVGLKQGCVLSPSLFNLYMSDFPDIFDSTCDLVTLKDSNLSCLMFADDVVLMSESSQGLQHCLNRLASYCNKWNLTINTSKTKIIIFNKGGHKISRFNFLLCDTEIDVVQDYTYLGIVFSSGGSFTKACKALRDKAFKAFFKLRQLDSRNNVPMTLKLFDTLVSPILTYGSPVWGPTLVKESSKDFKKICDSAISEKINVKLCKYILGSGKYSVNDAVRGELGRYPVMIKVLSNGLKFFQRLQNLPDSTQVKSSHQDVILQPHFFNKTSWLHKLDHCIRRFSCTFNDSATKLQSMMELNYKQAWLNTIHNGGELRSYAVFKRDFFLEKYLLHESLVNRKNLTRLRISSHKLSVETGRFNKTPLENRLCAMCDKGLVEDEFHFMISCTAYEKPRDHLFKYLSGFTDIQNFPDNEIFSVLMSCNNGDYEFTKVVCNFVNLSFEMRSDHLKSVNQIL